MATFFVIFIWATLPCVEIAYITHTPCETTWQPQNIIALSSLEMLLLLCCLFGLYFIFLFRGSQPPNSDLVSAFLGTEKNFCCTFTFWALCFCIFYDLIKENYTRMQSEASQGVPWRTESHKCE